MTVNRTRPGAVSSQATLLEKIQESHPKLKHRGNVLVEDGRLKRVYSLNQESGELTIQNGDKRQTLSMDEVKSQIIEPFFKKPDDFQSELIAKRTIMPLVYNYQRLGLFEEEDKSRLQNFLVEREKRYEETAEANRKAFIALHSKKSNATPPHRVPASTNLTALNFTDRLKRRSTNDLIEGISFITDLQPSSFKIFMEGVAQYHAYILDRSYDTSVLKRDMKLADTDRGVRKAAQKISRMSSEKLDSMDAHALKELAKVSSVVLAAGFASTRSRSVKELRKGPKLKPHNLESYAKEYFALTDNLRKIVRRAKAVS